MINPVKSLEYGHCSYHEKRALTLQVEQHSPRME